MTPTTRSAASAQEELPKEEPITASATTKERLFEEPIALRSKEIPSSDPVEEDNEHGVESAPAATPKINKLEITTQQGSTSTSTKTSIDIQIPGSIAKTPRSRSSPIPDSQEIVTDDEGDQTFEPLSASKQLEEEATQKLASQGRLLGSDLESTPSAGVTKSPRAKSGENARGESTPQPRSKQIKSFAEDEPTPKPKAAKSTRVVFGDDDDVDKFVAAAADKKKEEDVAQASDDDHDDGEEHDESDDEAPEAVPTAVAAREILKSAKAAREAAEQYAVTTKRKRQARDNLLKQQAEKRKRTDPSKPGEKGAPEGEGEDAIEEQNTRSKRQRRTQKLPDVLPAEFLTDSSEDEDDETTLKKIVKRPQKITFDTAVQILSADGRPPRDEVVGSTRYRVLAQQSDQRLAPKANKDSRKKKDALLRRGRTRVAQNKKRGFFVK